ncbi:ABC transporter permease [Ktedonospora formicarum]|uniref:ABC transmembrane type-2 domain-containing protein n=1 Tax=Ktedonospora formicarum TaxID=2778364 RepID=A0A8J3ICM9_9CHLR|nr:ABC transporter permease [Ktedonospora formicarum]GHO50257.1 hypothetical protein KSX_84200 [Ktedonospora formicarum]
MRTLWHIAKKDLLQVIKDKHSLILLLLVPLLLITIMGSAFGNAFGNNSNPIAFTVALSNQDSGHLGETIVKALQSANASFTIDIKAYSSTKNVLQSIKDEKAVAGIIIPSGTTQKLQDAASKSKSVSNIVQFYTRPNSNDQRISLTQQIVTNVLNNQINAMYAGSAAVQEIQALCKQPGNACDYATIKPEAISKSIGEASQTSKNTTLIQTLTTGNAPKSSNFDQLLPGFSVLFALFGLNSAASTILQEKEEGTFRRLLIAPVPRYALLGGKLVAQFLLTLLQLTVLFTIGYWVFKLNIGSWQAIGLLLISTSFATTGLGMLLVSIVKSRRQLTPVVTLTTLVTSAIGGSWWPLWSEPQWMQQIAKIGVTAWAIEGLNGVMIFGKSLAEIQFNVLGLLGYGLICFLLALRLFRFQEQSA